MKIPWDPVTSGAGSFGPAIATKAFMKYYSTPGGEVSHKAFQNLPMNTEAPPVIVPPAGAKHGSKVRDLPTGVGYTDRFTAHPVPGNYVQIVAHLDGLREANKRAIEESRDNYPTLLELIEHNYKNVGRNMDSEAQNSIRDRLRQSGASDEEIEVIMKEARIKKLKEMSEKAESKEQEYMRLLTNVRLRQEPGGKQDKPYARADQNVFNFPMPAPIMSHMSNLRAEPGNEIFAGHKSAGVNPPGPPAPKKDVSFAQFGIRNVDEMIRQVVGGAGVAEPIRVVRKGGREPKVMNLSISAPIAAPVVLERKVGAPPKMLAKAGSFIETGGAAGGRAVPLLKEVRADTAAEAQALTQKALAARRGIAIRKAEEEEKEAASAVVRASAAAATAAALRAAGASRIAASGGRKR